MLGLNPVQPDLSIAHFPMSEYSSGFPNLHEGLGLETVLQIITGRHHANNAILVRALPGITE